jgi:hypothetical protein
MDFHRGYINNFTDPELLLDYILHNGLTCDLYAINRVNILRNLDFIINAATDSTPLGSWAELNNMIYNPSIQYRMWQIQQFEYSVATYADMQMLTNLAQHSGLINNSIFQKKLRTFTTSDDFSQTRAHPLHQNMATHNTMDYLHNWVDNTVAPNPTAYQQPEQSNNYNEVTSTQVKEKAPAESLDDLLEFADTLPVFTAAMEIYPCNLCMEVFMEKHLLRNHMRKSHKVTYACLYCASVFHRQVDVRQHTLNVHADIECRIQYGGGVTRTADQTADEPEHISKQQPRKRRKLNNDSEDSERRVNDGDAYLIEKRHDKRFKNGAIDHVFDVKFNEAWQGENITDILTELDDMFEEILLRAKEGMADNDLVRLVISHDHWTGAPSLCR